MKTKLIEQNKVCHIRKNNMIISVMMDEIPVGNKDIKFKDIGLEHLGIDFLELQHAELVRIISNNLHECRILKDRYSLPTTIYSWINITVFVIYLIR